MQAIVVDARSASPWRHMDSAQGYKVRIFTNLMIRNLKI